MFSPSLLSILQLAVITQGNPYCPMDKKVGDTCYTRVDTTIDFKKFECDQDCTYKKTGSEDEQLYCFKKGPLPVSECGNTIETLPISDGFVRIVSDVISSEVSGSVTFKESSDCDVNGPQKYEIDSTNTAYVGFNGTCDVEEITASVTGTPRFDSCKYNPLISDGSNNPEKSDNKDFKVSQKRPRDCDIEPAEPLPFRIRVINNSQVPIRGWLYAIRQRPLRMIRYGLILPGNQRTVRTPWPTSDGFSAFNTLAPAPQRCTPYQVAPSWMYTIGVSPNHPFCNVNSAPVG